MMILSTRVPLPPLLPSGNQYSVLCIYVFSLICGILKKKKKKQ